MPASEPFCPAFVLMKLEPLSHDDLQARALFEQGRFAEAELLFRRNADAKPNDAIAQYHLGVTLERLDRTEEAIGFYRAAITLNPAFSNPYNNLASCLSELNLIEQARQGFAIAHQAAPDDPVPILNEGISALTLGDYRAGWKGFAARWRLPAYAKFKRTFDKPVWQGESLSGKTLFLYAEQGFGDSLQMARFIPLLIKQGAKIVAEMPPALVTLMRSLDGAPQIIVKGDPIPDFDFYCAMMDLPGAAGTELDTIPADIPYLRADADTIAAYREKLSGARRIGLSWAGRATHQNDRNRSLALAQLSPLFTRGDIEWVSLQRVVPDRDCEDLEKFSLADWGRASPDFAATAAMIETLDLVITVDTAVAHLAGALGKPVWILLPFHPDWRWLLEREDSPWYPTARLFRQRQRGDWSEVVARVAATL
ncbi:MAG: tetratricopeptide repeat protein [Alphaproteobacteria bacterium]|nr:tetratricopeptide repeat protein [Alphaproteobacteria bacterium]